MKEVLNGGGNHYQSIQPVTSTGTNTTRYSVVNSSSGSFTVNSGTITGTVTNNPGSWGGLVAQVGYVVEVTSVTIGASIVTD
ncbi:MAG: hypothetical protein OHK0029_31760 [Armatimonadaceae bacterium]